MKQKLFRLIFEFMIQCSMKQLIYPPKDRIIYKSFFFICPWCFASYCINVGAPLCYGFDMHKLLCFFLFLQVIVYLQSGVFWEFGRIIIHSCGPCGMENHPAGKLRLLRTKSGKVSAARDSHTSYLLVTNNCHSSHLYNIQSPLPLSEVSGLDRDWHHYCSMEEK